MIFEIVVFLMIGVLTYLVICFGPIIWRSTFVKDLGSAFVSMAEGTLEMLGIEVPDVEPSVTTTWCQGCDEVVSEEYMKFTDDHYYRCDVCRGIESPTVVEALDNDVIVVRRGSRTEVMSTAKYMERYTSERQRVRCDVCERSAPEWLARTTGYRCVECRRQFPVMFPATRTDIADVEKARPEDFDVE